MRKNILVISSHEDVETDALEAALIKRGQSIWRFPVEDFFRGVQLSVEYGGPPAVLQFPQGKLTLDSVSSVLFRRHVFELLPQAPRDDIEMFAQLEVEAAFRGMVDLLADARLVNDPFKLYALEPRLAQFARAEEAGFALPRSLVTNDMERAREFQAECEAEFIGTQKAPYFLRERISQGVKVRLHVVGERVFGCGIPPFVQDQSLLFARRTGLLFAAIDFIRTVDDQFLFLRCDARPAWLDERQSNGDAVTQALSNLLAQGL